MNSSPASSWKIDLHPGKYPGSQDSIESFKRLTDTEYIEAPTTQEVKDKIRNVIGNSHVGGQNVLVLFWAVKKIKENIFILTTTGQPYGLFGDNQELSAFHQDCLHQKLYVYEDEDPEMISAIGLPGRVLMTRTPKETKNMHDYPKNYRPPSQFEKNGPSENVLYTRTWASFGVLVDSGSYKHPDGVLEFVMDKPKDSNYDVEINLVCEHLQSLLLQPSIQIEPNANREAILGYPKTSIKSEYIKTTYGKRQKRERVTQAKKNAAYFRLARCFGLSSKKAMEKLGIKSPTTFKNHCREEGIREWPYIGNTTNRAGSVNEAQINQISLTGTSYFGSPNVSDDISCQIDFSDHGNGDIPALSNEEGEHAFWKKLLGMEDTQLADSSVVYHNFAQIQEQDIAQYINQISDTLLSDYSNEGEAGIREWPYIGNTTNRAACANEAQINQISLIGTSYFGFSNASDDISSLTDFSVNGNEDILALLNEEGEHAYSNKPLGMEDTQLADSFVDYDKFAKDREKHMAQDIINKIRDTLSDYSNEGDLDISKLSPEDQDKLAYLYKEFGDLV